MKKFLSILLAAIMVVCIAVPTFADDLTAEYPSEYKASEAEAGVHAVDGVIGADEYDVKIENIHKDNELHTYGHNPWFGAPAEGFGVKESDSSVFSFYIGYDADNFYWAVAQNDGPRGESPDPENPVYPYSRVAVYLWVGDFNDEYSIGVQFKNAGGVLEAMVNQDAMYSQAAQGAIAIEDESWYKYNEIVNEDETITEVWELMLPWDYIAEFTGTAVGEEFYFKFVAETDNTHEVINDRFNFGASLNSDAPILESATYWAAADAQTKLFKLAIDHVCTYTFEEVEGGHQGVCSCGERAEEVLDHDWDTGIITKDATVDEEGELLYTCYDCGAEKTEAIAKLDPPADEPADEPADDKTDDGAADDGANAGDDTTDDAKGGCGASITVMGLALVATLGLGVTVLSKKN